MQENWRRSLKLSRNHGLNIYSDLSVLKRNMFWMWEGKYMVSAWLHDIDHFLHNEANGMTPSIALSFNSLGFVGTMLDSMHNVNMLQDYVLISFACDISYLKLLLFHLCCLIHLSYGTHVFFVWVHRERPFEDKLG